MQHSKNHLPSKKRKSNWLPHISRPCLNLLADLPTDSTPLPILTLSPNRNWWDRHICNRNGLASPCKQTRDSTKAGGRSVRKEKNGPDCRDRREISVQITIVKNQNFRSTVVSERENHFSTYVKRVADFYLWIQSTRTFFRFFKNLSMDIAAMQPSEAATTTCLNGVFLISPMP